MTSEHRCSEKRSWRKRNIGVYEEKKRQIGWISGKWEASLNQKNPEYFIWVVGKKQRREIYGNLNSSLLSRMEMKKSSDWQWWICVFRCSKMERHTCLCRMKEGIKTTWLIDKGPVWNDNGETLRVFQNSIVINVQGGTYSTSSLWCTKFDQTKSKGNILISSHF